MEILRIDDENLKSIPTNASCHLQLNPMKERNLVMTNNQVETMDKFAAQYLLRALQALGYANFSVSESDFKGFASSLRNQMELWIGDEEAIRDIFGVIGQINDLNDSVWDKVCFDLQEKLRI